jgi:hypothetical protein
VVTGSSYGIGGQGVNGSSRNQSVTISGNVVASCGYGIFMLMSGADGTYFHQDINIVGNEVSGAPSSLPDNYHLEYCDGLSLSGGSAIGGFKSGVTMLDCINWYVGDMRIRKNNLAGLKTVSSLTESGSTATAISAAHGYPNGQVISMFGASPTQYQASNSAITVVDGNTFTYGLSHSGLTSPAVGKIQCSAPNSLSGGGLKISYSLVTPANSGVNRMGVNTIAYNGFQDLYEFSLNGVTGLVNDTLFIADNDGNPRPENLTSGLSANVEDRLGLYMKNGKIVIAYNNAGTVNYLSAPLDGSTATWTNGATAP